MNLLMSIMAMFSLIFMWLKHPLTMTLVIIMQTLTVSMFIGMMMGSFWFSYIVLIIMLSGMLVLFVYMASIASNEKFHPSIKMVLLSSTVFIATMYLIMDTEGNMETMEGINMSMTLIKLFSSSTMMMTIIMVLYLFFSMILVSHIVNISEGPLRIKK